MDRTTDSPRLLPRIAAVCGRVLIIGAFILALAWLVAHLTLVFVPVALALLAASVLTPPVRWLSEHGWNRGLAAILVLLAVLALLVGFFTFLVPQVRQQLSEHSEQLAQGFSRFLERAEAVLPMGQESVERLRGRIGEFLRGQLGSITQSVLSGLVTLAEFLTGFLLTLVLLFFFLRDGPKLANWLFERWSPRRYREDVRAVATRTWGTLHGYLRGLALIALVDATGIGLGLFIIGVPLALPLALLTFIASFVPIVGAVTAGLVAVLVALVSGGLVDALLVLAVVMGVQQLESNVLEPVIMGRAIPLHPVAVLLAITAGALLAGVLGAFFSVPLAAALSAAGNELRLRMERARGTPA